MTPLGANADTGQPARQTACPALLMERECNDYQAARRAAQSDTESALLEDKYAALIKERARMCPCLLGLGETDEVGRRVQTKHSRLVAGRKIRM
jgi:hypothetical protein